MDLFNTLAERFKPLKNQKIQSNVIKYTLQTDEERGVNKVDILNSKNKIIAQIECLIDSPYTIAEEVQMYMEENIIDLDYEITKI